MVVKTGSGLLQPGQAAPVTYEASGTLPRAGDLAHSLNHMAEGIAIPREALLTAFQPSRLPGEAVSPLL